MGDGDISRIWLENVRVSMSGEKVPTRKVGAGALAGALSVIIVWVVSEAGMDVPAEISSAFTTVLTFVTSWLIPER